MSTTTLLLIAGIIIFFIIPSLKDRVIPVKKIIIIPVLFMYMLYQTITESFALGFASMLAIIAGLIIGVGIGIYLRRDTPVKADKQQNLIWLPGSYLSLIIFPLIFIVHYIVGYIHAVKSIYLSQEGMIACILLLLLTATSSLIVGTNLCLGIKYHFATTEKLSVPVRRR